MCGRMCIFADPLNAMVSDLLGFSYTAKENTDLCPAQVVSAFTAQGAGYEQGELLWGIKPDWSKRLLINAQSESAAEKTTFKNAYTHNRCLVPVSGWYEWRTDGNKGKEKFLFSHTQKQPLFMAALWFPGVKNQLVTLTTSPNKLCGEYHNRMPLLILPEHIDHWLTSPPQQLKPILAAIDEELITVAAA